MASLSLAFHGLASSRPPSSSPFYSHLSFQPPRCSFTNNIRLVVAMASRSNLQDKDKDLSDKISSSIKDAEELCKAGVTSGECAAAWDEVEELSSTAAHKRVQAKLEKDPLEQYCKDQPEADECRVYED